MMQLAEVLRMWRKMKDVSVRDAAKQMGIGFATLSRVERGEMMDGKTLAAILRWLVEAKV